MRAYNEKQERRARDELAACWQTAAFTGRAFAGKLRSLKNYLPKNQKPRSAPSVGKDEFERRLKLAQEAKKNGAGESQG